MWYAVVAFLVGCAMLIVWSLVKSLTDDDEGV
jgi:hypothetical protein